MYQRIVIKRSKSASKATQENFETIAALLRKRALGGEEADEGLRKRDLEVEERDELKGFVKDTNTEIRREPERPHQQRQVLKGSRRALNGSVSHIITIGLKDIQNVFKQIFGMRSFSSVAAPQINRHVFIISESSLSSSLYVVTS